VAQVHADHNIADLLVDELKASPLHHDVVTAADLGLIDATDSLHLLRAALSGRILLTHDKGFPPLHEAWTVWTTELAWGPRHAGILQRCLGFKYYTTICNSAPSEFLTALALRHRGTLVKRNLEIVQRNLALLDAFIQRRADLVEWVKPNASPIGFVRFKPERDVFAFARTLCATPALCSCLGASMTSCVTFVLAMDAKTCLKHSYNLMRTWIRIFDLKASGANGYQMQG